MLLRRITPAWLFIESISSIAATLVDNEDDIKYVGNFNPSSSPDTSGVTDEGADCALWLAPSTLFGGEHLGLYSGKNALEGSIVGRGDLIIPVFDVNLNDLSPWHDLLWNQFSAGKSNFQLPCLLEGGVFLPGLGSLLSCKDGYGNVEATANYTEDCLGVHRNNDPAAGSFSCRNKFEFRASKSIYSGQELVLACDSSTPSLGGDIEPPPTMSVDWLHENNAICLDTLVIQPSKVAPGYGAFSKALVKAGQTVASSPIALMHRSQTEIVETFETCADETFERRGKVKYTDNVISEQLLLNYAYGNPNSNVLLLPYGPAVNFINHATVNSSQANVRIRWSTSLWNNFEIFGWSAIAATEVENYHLLVDYVALRDIEVGEEILLDYGHAWQVAWETHVEKWSPPSDSEKYISAVEYVRKHGHRLLTLDEQRENPYPENIMTSCSLGCMHPCILLERLSQGRRQFYLVELSSSSNTFALKDTTLAGTADKLHRVPADSIHLVDVSYTEDEHLRNAFRQVIGVNDAMYPQHWFARDPDPLGDFQRPRLKPGDIEPIRWAHNDEIVTHNAYLLGLPPQIRIELLKYCDRMGITDKLRDATIRGNPLPSDGNEKIALHSFSWLLQRPPDHWHSNIHWLSPVDETSNADYLMALSAAGFDDILSSVGTKLGLSGLACYQVTFIGISYCKQGYVHHDMKNTADAASKSRAFNIIIPLILANDTGPELDVTTADQDSVGRLRYQYDVAVMVSWNKGIKLTWLDGSNTTTDLTDGLHVKVGDDAHHASSATDYRANKEMRMAATIYIGDIDPGNIEEIMNYYTQTYPPADRPDLLLSMAGTHWNANNLDVKLPKPNKVFEALSLKSSAEGEVSVW
jgi:hypothetical protein